MRNRRSFALLATVLTLLLLVGFVSTRASYSDLHITQIAVLTDTITVSVHNPTGNSETARIQTTVKLDNNSLETLTSGNFTVSSGGTVPVSMTASRPIVSIQDAPAPIEPL